MCTLKNQGGDTFWKNNSVSFVITFLIGRAIRHFQFFLRLQYFCSNISERGNNWSNDLYFCDNWPLKTPFLALKCVDHPLKQDNYKCIWTSESWRITNCVKRRFLRTNFFFTGEFPVLPGKELVSVLSTCSA